MCPDTLCVHVRFDRYRPQSVSFIDYLPIIETEAQSTRRTTDQVASRAMALCVVTVKGERLDVRRAPQN